MILKGVQRTFSVNYGKTRTGKTVTFSVLDTSGNVVGSGYTAGSVIELGDGNYAVAVTFSATMTGYVKWNNTTDAIELFEPILVIEDFRTDLTAIKKVNLNRWKIENNQMKIYDDNGTSVLYTFDLKKAGVANDGTDPDERTPA